jgi:hypothetical protein
VDDLLDARGQREDLHLAGAGDAEARDAAAAPGGDRQRPGAAACRRAAGPCGPAGLRAGQVPPPVRELRRDVVRPWQVQPAADGAVVVLPEIVIDEALRF